jgi:hypothetical protein
MPAPGDAGGSTTAASPDEPASPAAPAGPPPSALAPGLPPATLVAPVPTSPEEQALLGAPRDDDAAAAGLVQADPARIFGIDAPDLTGFAVSIVRGLSYGASLRTEYSDNVARRASSAGLPSRYNSRTDWRFTPQATVSAGQPFGRQTLFLNAGIGRDYYARNTALDRDRARVAGGLQWVLGSRCAGRIQGDYSTRQTSSDLFDEYLPSTQERVAATVGGTCRVASRLSANLAYDWYEITNGLESRRMANSKAHGLVAGLTYPIARRGSVSISGFWRTTDFPNQLLLTGETNQIKFSGFSVGGGYRIGPAFSLNGSIGRTKADYRNPFLPSFTGTTWSAGLNYAGPKIGVNISTGRSASSGSGNSNFSVSTHYTGTVRYALGQRIHTSVGYSHRKSDNRARLEIPSEGLADNNRKSDTLMANMDYDLNRLLSLSAEYRHEHQAARLLWSGYSTNIASLSVRANF